MKISSIFVAFLENMNFIANKLSSFYLIISKNSPIFPSGFGGEEFDHIEQKDLAY